MPAVDYVDVQIADIRGREEEFHLDTQGFQYVKKQSVEKDFDDNEKIKEVYYPECAELVQKL
jgi:hypothetical protein